jgi:REP element-mobilizing transposase RayT
VVPTHFECGRLPPAGDFCLSLKSRRRDAASHTQTLPPILGYTASPMCPCQQPPHSHKLRLHRKMEGPGTFFVTKCLDPRRPVINELVASEVCSALCFYAEKKLIYLGAFVVMLDHWHVVLATADGKPISRRMQNLGQWLDRRCGNILSGRDCDWQDGFYETRIRSARLYQFVCGYVEENPVRAGLVHSPSDWK